MSFFAVLKPEGNSSDFEVLQAHINLWSLGGLMGHRNFLFDVGLRLKANTKTINDIEVVLPFTAKGSALIDLREKMRDQATLELIFGKYVSLETTTGMSTIKYDDKPVTLVGIDMTPGKSTRVSEESEKDFTLWKLNFSTPIEHGSQGYVRVRFRVWDIGRVWVWKRFLYVNKNGARIDFRASDIRDSWEVPIRDSIRTRIVKIEDISFFVITPESLQLHATSPQTHYMRLFEGRAWEKYLDTAISHRRSLKTIIYQWRGHQVTIENPFRVFLDLNREFGFTIIGNHLTTAFFVLIFILIYSTVSDILPTFQEYRDMFQKGWKLILGIIGSITILTLTTRIKQVRVMFSHIKNGFYWIEQLSLRLRKGL